MVSSILYRVVTEGLSDKTAFWAEPQRKWGSKLRGYLGEEHSRRKARALGYFKIQGSQKRSVSSLFPSSLTFCLFFPLSLPSCFPFFLCLKLCKNKHHFKWAESRDTFNIIRAAGKIPLLPGWGRVKPLTEGWVTKLKTQIPWVSHLVS